MFNSLRIAEVERKPYMDRACDTQAGAKHRCPAAALRYLRAEVMEMCQNAGLYQINLLGGSKNRVTEREYWARKKGQLALDAENTAQGKPPTKFETDTDKEKLSQEIRAVLAVAVSFEDFAQRLLQRGITIKESRGGCPISPPTGPSLSPLGGWGTALTAPPWVPLWSATPLGRTGEPSPASGSRCVGTRASDIEAKKAQGKGKGYERWATTFNLKQEA